MPWWIVADVDGSKNGLLGPYWSESKALSIKEGLDDGHATLYSTVSDVRKEAVQEIRGQEVESGNVSAGWQNFKHKGVKVND